MDLYADQKVMRQLVSSVREELELIETVLLTAVSPEGAVKLRQTLERINTVDEYDPADRGTLFAWATETLDYLESERRRHAGQVTAIHTLLREAGHGCARGQIEEVLGQILRGRHVACRYEDQEGK